MVSLGLVSPGVAAATDGVAPIFSWKKTGYLFLVMTVCHLSILQCQLYYEGRPINKLQNGIILLILKI